MTRFLSNYATINMVDALSRISGVGEVKMLGSSDYAMRVWVKPDIMSKLDITIEDVTKALQDQNVISPGGKFGAEPAPVRNGVYIWCCIAGQADPGRRICEYYY